MEELGREQRSYRAQGVTHKTLASNGRGCAWAIAISRVAVRRLEDEVDTESDRGETDSRADPGEVGVLCEAVDEQAHRQPDGAVHSAVESSLRGDLNVRVGDESVVLAHLKVVGHPGQSRSDGQTDVRQAADAFGPATLLSECDGDDGKEHEGNTPAEGNPEAERENHRLGDKHVNSLDRRGLQHRLDIRRIDVALGYISLVAGSLAQSHSSLVELNPTSSLREEEEYADQEWNVGQALNTLDPTPPDGLVDEASVDGCSNCTEDGDPREQCHGPRTFVREVHVIEGTTNKDSSNTTEQTEQEPQSDNSSDILGERQANEEQGEAEKRAGVNNLPTDKLAERCQDHGRDGTGEVESEQAKLTDFLGRVQVLDHAADSRAVCCRGQTNEQSHQAKHGSHHALIPRTPVVGVLLVVGGILENNVLLVVVVDELGQSEWHINVNSFYCSTISVDLLVGWVDVFSSNDASNLWVSLLVSDHLVRMFQHRHNIWRGLLSLHLERRAAGP